MKNEEKTIISLRKDALKQLLTLTELGAMDTETFYFMLQCIYAYEELGWEEDMLIGLQYFEELAPPYKSVLESIRQGGFLAYNRYAKINSKIEENNRKKRAAQQRNQQLYTVDGVTKNWSTLTPKEKQIADKGLYELELQEQADTVELPFSDD